MGVRRVLLAAWLAALTASCQLIVDLDGLDDMKCRADEKPCPSLKLCAKKDDANTGCASESCTPCALPHSMARCDSNGQCKVVGCDPGWNPCDEQTEECQTDTQHDPDHCGSCTTVCPAYANAFRGCAGTCTIGGCKPGWGNCNGNALDGCETEVLNNPVHCGRCNNPCASCQNGVCPSP